MRSLSSKPNNAYSKPLGYSSKATSTFSKIFVVILFQRCQSTNYSSMWEISVDVGCAPVWEKIKPSCERKQAIYRASLTISDPASSPWPPATSSLALPWFTDPALDSIAASLFVMNWLSWQIVRRLRQPLWEGVQNLWGASAHWKLEVSGVSWWISPPVYIQ